MSFWYKRDGNKQLEIAEKIIKTNYHCRLNHCAVCKSTDNCDNFKRLKNAAKVLIDEGFGYASEVVKIFLNSVEEELPNLFYYGATPKQCMERLDDLRVELFGGDYEE